MHNTTFVTYLISNNYNHQQNIALNIFSTIVYYIVNGLNTFKPG